MVLVKLNGGNDGLNTVIPKNQLSNLSNARPHVFIPENKIIDLGKKDLGLHPELTGFKSLFDEQRLKIIQNVGYETPDFLILDQWIYGNLASIIISLLPMVGWEDTLKTKHQEYPNSYPNTQYPDPLRLN